MFVDLSKRFLTFFNKNLSNSQCYTAFTLAEVLITLGIIGIVAAMTIPTLIQNSKKQETVVELKKFYATMEQAIRLSENDNGTSLQWDMLDHEINFFNTYFASYIKYLKIVNQQTPVINNETRPWVYLSDGSIIYLHSGGCADFNIDVNGAKKPNEYGRDVFAFVFCQGNAAQSYLGSTNKTFGPYMSVGTRENLLDNCKSTPASCASLIMYDGWQIKDDYPYKL